MDMTYRLSLSCRLDDVGIMTTPPRAAERGATVVPGCAVASIRLSARLRPRRFLRSEAPKSTLGARENICAAGVTARVFVGTPTLEALSRRKPTSARKANTIEA